MLDNDGWQTFKGKYFFLLFEDCGCGCGCMVFKARAYEPEVQDLVNAVADQANFSNISLEKLKVIDNEVGNCIRASLAELN